MLIVEDSPMSELPAAVAAAEEIPLALINVNMPELRRWAGYYTENCLQQPGCTPAMCVNPIWGAGELGESVLLVNGQTRPTISMAANRWYRWRLLYASGGGEVIYPTLAGCEVGLLQKDGVYLDSAPRPIKKGYMAAGNRADWLVRCPSGSFVFGGVSGSGPKARIGPNWVNDTADFAYVEVKDEGDVAVDIAPFAARRPCYLANLVDVPTAAPIVLDGRSMYQFSGQSFAGPESYMHEIEVGSVVSMELYGLHYQNHMGHILHVHVNPFQLSEDPLDTFDGYFQAGDWHDTLKGPYGWGRETPIKIKMAADRFTGGQVVHCHYLWHQDRGMMYVMKLSGEEGATFAGASTQSPGCFKLAEAEKDNMLLPYGGLVSSTKSAASLAAEPSLRLIRPKAATVPVAALAVLAVAAAAMVYLRRRSVTLAPADVAEQQVAAMM